MDFSQMNGPQLVAVWNEMVITATDLGLNDIRPVKKFSDAETGRIRCEKLHTEIQKYVGAEGIPDFLRRAHVSAIPQVAPVARMSFVEDPPRRDFRIPKGMTDEEGQAMLARQAQAKKDKAVARVELMKQKLAEKNALKLRDVNAKREEKGLATLASLNDKGPIVKQEKVMATKKSKSNGAAKGKWMANDATITKLAKENPKRKGTRGYQLWEKYKNGMTVGAWKEAGKQYAMPYLRWDIAHGLIKVS